MAQKVVLKVINMTNDKMKQKAIEAAADIYGVDSIAAELKNQELLVVGEMDTVAVVKKLKKATGIVDIVSVGPLADEEPPPSPPPPPEGKKKKKKKKKKKQNKKDEVEEKEEFDDDEEFMEF